MRQNASVCGERVHRIYHPGGRRDLDAILHGTETMWATHLGFSFRQTIRYSGSVSKKLMYLHNTYNKANTYKHSTLIIEMWFFLKPVIQLKYLINNYVGIKKEL